VAFLYLLVFLASAWSGSTWAWTVLSAFFGDVAADLSPGGASPWDGYDGLVAGPLVWGVLEAPLRLVLGPVGLVHVLATAGVATAGIVLSYFLVRRSWGELAGALAATFLAFPPPTLWLHAHAGAYHALIVLLLPLGLLLIGEPEAPERRMREWWGVVILALALASQLGNIGVVGPALFAWWFLRSRSRGRWLWRDLPRHASAAVVGTAPLWWKLLFHTPWQGLLPPGAAGPGRAVKPLFLAPPAPAKLLGRLKSMLVDEAPYGLHWELAGLRWAAEPWVLVVLVLWGVAAWAAWKRGGRGIIPILGPAGVVAAGAMTGWFVLISPGEEPFSRDGRHLTAFVLGLAWSSGAAASLWLQADGRARKIQGGASVLAAGFLVLVGGVGLSRTVDVRGLRDARWESPFRLNSRYVAGYFRAPFFRDVPQLGATSCRVYPGPEAVDCLRGLWMGFGAEGAGGVIEGKQPAREILWRCARATEGFQGGAPSSIESCALGLGWGISDLLFRRPARAALTCRRDPALGAEGARWCIRGAGWATAQNFPDRPEALDRWLDAAPPEDGALLAEGVGLYLTMISEEDRWLQRQCGLLLGDRAGHCLALREWNAQFQPSRDDGPPGPQR
jgi:hypothetical protein